MGQSSLVKKFLLVVQNQNEVRCSILLHFDSGKEVISTFSTLFSIFQHYFWFSGFFFFFLILRYISENGEQRGRKFNDCGQMTSIFRYYSVFFVNLEITFVSDFFFDRLSTLCERVSAVRESTRRNISSRDIATELNIDRKAVWYNLHKTDVRYLGCT